LLLVDAYKNLNQDATSEVITFTISNLKGTSLIDLLEIDKDMVLSMVKKQLNQYKVRKVSDDGHKYPFAW
jgi:hypothetical protein